MVEAFKGAYGGRADGNNRTVSDSGCEFGYKVAADGDELAVHVVVAYFIAFYGAESAGSDMERHFAARNAGAVDFCEQFISKMQPGRGSGHRAVDMAVYGLIVGGVAFFRFAVEGGRNGKFSECRNNIGEAE